MWARRIAANLSRRKISPPGKSPTLPMCCANIAKHAMECRAFLLPSPPSTPAKDPEAHAPWWGAPATGQASPMPRRRTAVMMGCPSPVRRYLLAQTRPVALAANATGRVAVWARQVPPRVCARRRPARADAEQRSKGPWAIRQRPPAPTLGQHRAGRSWWVHMEQHVAHGLRSYSVSPLRLRRLGFPACRSWTIGAAFAPPPKPHPCCSPFTGSTRFTLVAVFAVNRNGIERAEALPWNAGRVFHPILVGRGMAAIGALLCQCLDVLLFARLA